jgi:chromosome segregation ATPase
LLTRTIDKARKLRAAMPRFLGTDQKVQEIFQLLNSASIQLPTVITPLAQRELLTAAEITRKITPLQLLVVMVKTFQVVKETILEVDHVWNDLEPQLDRSEAEIVNLQRRGEASGINCKELENAPQAIATLRDRIESDPFGTSANFDDIKRLITQIRTEIDQFVLAQEKLKQGFSIAQMLLQQLMVLNQNAIAAFTECQEKITDYPSIAPPLPLEQIEALGQWLQRLETKLKEGLTSPVRVGLENCLAKINEYIATERKTIAINRLAIQTRQELRGRLDALKAKALAKGFAEDIQLTILSEKAKQILYCRPTPLKQAEETVKQYETMLNSKF